MELFMYIILVLALVVIGNGIYRLLSIKPKIDEDSIPEEWAFFEKIIRKMEDDELIKQKKTYDYMQSLGGINLLKRINFIQSIMDERGL